MSKKFITVLLLVLSVFLFLSCRNTVYPGRSGNDGDMWVSYVKNSEYSLIEARGFIPYVFVPQAASSDPGSALNVGDMLSVYGKREGILAATNAGIFYNWGWGSYRTTQYCFNIKEADGMVIASGIVLKSGESLDHTECEPLVIDNSGNVGWADYWADADALAAGTYYYYDIHGRRVDQSVDSENLRIVSAVTGFVPILIDGVNQFDSSDTFLHGYHNYVGHYTGKAERIIFCADENGYAIINGKWTLQEAADKAKELGYIFAYNLDGGGSSSIYIGKDTDGDGDIDNNDDFSSSYEALKKASRTVPTYIVFTSSNLPPQSARGSYLTAYVKEDSVSIKASPVISPEDIARTLVVEEHFLSSDGREGSGTRVLTFHPLLQEMTQNSVMDGKGNILRTSSVVSGVPYYTKSKDNKVSAKGLIGFFKETDEESVCLRYNGNTREGGIYQDYSTGYTISSADDLSTPGVKNIEISYSGLSVTVPVTLD